MIGFYNYTVILTYTGLISAIIGITQAISSNFRTAFLCLIISGVCDMFDGNVARTRKQSTTQERQFGIQIDSLCDLVCFGVLPAAIGYSLCPYKWLGGIAAVLLILCGVIRLAYFNVMEEERQKDTKEKRKYYPGLPITSTSVVVPAIFVLRHILGTAYPIVYIGVILIEAFLFVKNFKFRKPGKTGEKIMAVYGVLLLFGVLFI